jgi:anti-anti-sigma factor
VNSPSIAVVKLSGELDVGRRAEIRAALVVPPKETAVLVDFSEVTYADSTAVAELLRFHAVTVPAAVRVAVLIGSRQFARLLDYAGLGDAFAIFDTRAAALTYLGQRAQ